jgi:hypothetical protein
MDGFSITGVVMVLAGLWNLFIFGRRSRETRREKFESHRGWIPRPLSRFVAPSDYYADLIPRLGWLAVLLGVLMLLWSLID